MILNVDLKYIFCLLSILLLISYCPANTSNLKYNFWELCNLIVSNIHLWPWCAQIAGFTFGSGMKSSKITHRYENAPIRLLPGLISLTLMWIYPLHLTLPPIKSHIVPYDPSCISVNFENCRVLSHPQSILQLPNVCYKANQNGCRMPGHVVSAYGLKPGCWQTRTLCTNLDLYSLPTSRANNRPHRYTPSTPMRAP